MKYVFFDGKSFLINNSKEKPYNRVLLTPEEYDGLLAQVKYEKELNLNLKRICRERACKKAGKPKNCSGYFVLSSAQVVEKFMKDVSFEDWKKENPSIHSSAYRSPVQLEYRAWKTFMQTPHDASVPFDIAEQLIIHELCGNVFAAINIDQMHEDKMNGIYPGQTSNNTDTGKNIVYRWSFRTDFKNGFWIFEFYHTQPITVSEEYRIISFCDSYKNM